MQRNYTFILFMVMYWEKLISPAQKKKLKKNNNKVLSFEIITMSQLRCRYQLVSNISSVFLCYALLISIFHACWIFEFKMAFVLVPTYPLNFSFSKCNVSLENYWLVVFWIWYWTINEIYKMCEQHPFNTSLSVFIASDIGFMKQ